MTTVVQGWHAHVYFDAGSVERARRLCEQAAVLFPVTMGRVHERPVGPHPNWSCQAFEPGVFAQVVPWLALNRQDLIVLIHPLSGNDLVDHRDRAIWMGAVRPLDLSVLRETQLPGEL